MTIASYTHNSIFTSGDSVPHGTQIILVCQFVGLPYGTPPNYTWTCPSGPCEVEGYYGRKVYNEHILAINTTSTSDGGKYTCRVTATGGQEATGNFKLRVIGASCRAAVRIENVRVGIYHFVLTTGGHVVHSYGRLIPHEFPITVP